MSAEVRGYVFDRPLVLLQSDDWGRLGVRDAEGYAQLQAAGVSLGENPYDFYTLETCQDISAVHDLLTRHHDSTGRSPCLGMNFVLANVDFPKTIATGFQQIHLCPLNQGLPGDWSRPGLLESYRQGVAEGVFYPALHGLTHFCRRAVEYCLAEDGERGTLLRTLWAAQTPYIYWRMPWIGYEYWNPEPTPKAGFLSAEEQQGLIGQAAKLFTDAFSVPPSSACAPGYRANHDTHQAWAECGVRVAQNGSGTLSPPQMDECGILNLYRAIDFEPAVHAHFSVERCVHLAEESFARGVPAIVSVHSINFHSSLKDFRGPTLHALDQFLAELEAKYPNLLYVHDGDMFDIVTRGKYESVRGAVSVGVRQQGASRPRRVAARGN